MVTREIRCHYCHQPCITWEALSSHEADCREKMTKKENDRRSRNRSVYASNTVYRLAHRDEINAKKRAKRAANLEAARKVDRERSARYRARAKVVV